MGGSSSKSMVSVLNQISMDASMRTIQSCSTSATQDQLMELEAQGSIVISNVKLTQGVQVNSKCLAQTQKQIELKNDVATAITNFAEASGPAVLGALGASKSEAYANISNILNTNINMDTVQESVTASLQRQKVKAKSTEGRVIVSNLTMEQTAKVWAEAIVSDEQFAKSIVSLASKIDQGTKAETTDPIANLVGAVTKGLAGAAMLPLIIGIVSIVIIIVLVLIIKLVSKVGKSAEGPAAFEVNQQSSAQPLSAALEVNQQPSAPPFSAAPPGTNLFSGGRRGNIYGGWA